MFLRFSKLSVLLVIQVLLLSDAAQLKAQEVINKSFSSDGTASVTADFYAPAYKLYGTPLRLALHNLIKGHTNVGYDGLYTHYPKTDTKPNGKVWDMYSDVPNGTSQYEYTHGQKKCGSYNGEGDCYNREHSWCDSWLGGTSPARSDLFHVYPTDGYVNNRRSNYPFGKVGNATWTSSNGSKLGNSISPGYSGTVFEPIDAYKGDFARSAMYMSVRYYLEDNGFSSSPATTKSDLNQWYADQMYQWGVFDTVSTKEINRNEAVYLAQRNRNPFIDHPEFAAEIWKTSMAPSVVVVKNNNAKTLLLDFSRVLDSVLVKSAANFEIDKQVGQPATIVWGVNNDYSKVLLTFNALAQGTNYKLTIKNMKSINGVAMNDTIVAFKTDGIQSLSEELKNPKNFKLEQNFPNPFNPTTEIRFNVKDAGYISLTVFDILGNQVAELANGYYSAGEHHVTFDAHNLTSGVYYYQMKSGNHIDTKRMMLVK